MKLISVFILMAFGMVLAAQFAASGEIQGDIDGIINISYWQKTHTRMAIFDAGSFSAKDESQNIEVCSLMQNVNYSAIAMGIDELRFSADFWENVNKKFNLPLVATNVKSSKKVFEKIRAVEYNRNAEKYAVVAIVGDENSMEISSDYEIENPRTALSAAISQIPNDYMIVLIAHCEPVLADSLINEFPRISFALQGYRKNGDEAFRFVGHKKVLNFGGPDKITVLDKKGDVRWRKFYTK